mgnify:CR=1 FL=1
MSVMPSSRRVMTSLFAGFSAATTLSLHLGGCSTNHTDNGADSGNADSASDCILGTWQMPEDYFTDGPLGGEGTLTLTFTPGEVTTEARVSQSFGVPQSADGGGIYMGVGSGSATNPYTLDEDQITFDSATSTDITYVTTLVDAEGKPLADPVVSDSTDDLGGSSFTVTCTPDNLILAGTPIEGLPDSMQPALNLVRVK